MRPADWLAEFDVVLTTREQFQMLVDELEKITSLIQRGDLAGQASAIGRLQTINDTLRQHVATQREPLAQHDTAI